MIVGRIFVPKIQELAKGWIKVSSIENLNYIEPKFKGVKIEKDQIGEELNTI